MVADWVYTISKAVLVKIKVHEPCDGNHICISSPTLPISTKRIPILKEKQVVMWVLTKDTLVYECRLVVYHSKVNARSYSRFMKPGIGIVDGFLLPPCHFLPSKSPFWRKVEYFCGYSS